MKSVTIRWPAVVVIAVALVGIGVLADVLAHRWRAAPPAAQVMPAAAPPASPGTGSDVIITLSDEMVARAGVRTEPVVMGTTATTLRVPAIVQANAYTQNVVSSVVPGRVTAVSAAIGDRVRAGQALAEIQSPALAEAETQYIAKQAEVQAAALDLQRIMHLVEAGVASRKQMERADAEHVRHTAELEAARAQLVLLGLSADRTGRLASSSDVGSTVTIVSPRTGVVIGRAANSGVAIDLSTPLFTIADLSTVWVVGSVYERDYSRVRVGGKATLEGVPGTTWQGAITYIDPQINIDTRAAQVRVEVPNSDGRLRLGAYATLVLVDAVAAPSLVVSSAAVQTIGDRTFVYVTDPGARGRFRERLVVVGPAAAGRVQVLGGLQAGDLVVTEGSFLLRAERLRLGGR